ncbi:MAG: CAAD domain-containing protein [Cyanobacteria bacterium]|nr:CAAD domain-containing protein [Cyanobacteriota bacterium]MDA1247277.1 CAAD domain-containing protein [Cyanobacteriota bacterium]
MVDDITATDPNPDPEPEPPTPSKDVGPAPQEAPPEPSIAVTLEIPASSGSSELEPQSDEGGEWELLLGKLRQWLDQNELNNLWPQARKPLTYLAALLGLLVVLRIYSAVLGALDSLPLVPGLLELAGVVWAVRYGIPKLLRSNERERLVGSLSQRWKAFRSKG